MNVLEKIKNGDPNENGTRDEIPFIGTGAGNANGYLFADFIMSAFVYADAEDYYMGSSRFSTGRLYCFSMFTSKVHRHTLERGLKIFKQALRSKSFVACVVYHNRRPV